MISGEDVRISNFAIIRNPEMVTVGSHVAIDEFVVISTSLIMGDYTHIAPMVSVIGGKRGLLRMGNFTTIAAGSRIICGSETYDGNGLIGPVIPYQYRDAIDWSPVIFEDFSIVATNVIVMPGVVLGEGSVVGAGSFVTKSTEPWTIYWGSPAKPRKQRNSNNIKRYARELGYA